MRIIYPGTFDPITNGHLDLAERSARIFEEVIIAVSKNPKKTTLFDCEERKYLVLKSTSHIKNVSIEIFDELLIDYAKSKGINQILRGLRAISDFEYEFQMALMNRANAPEIEFFYMMPSQTYTFLSSTLVKELASYNGNIDSFVTNEVKMALHRKMNK